MTMNKESIKCMINMPRTLPFIVAYHSAQEKSIIEKDIKRWIKILKPEYIDQPIWKCLNWLLINKQEYRNVFYHRINRGFNWVGRLLSVLYPKLPTFHIVATKIGPGFFVMHGIGTMIDAVEIGENCTIYQLVTCGHTEGVPTIRDNVTITAGSILLGGIVIGNNSIIGAGAVVTKNVPDDCTVVGNPAYIIKRNGVRVKEKL